LTLIHFPPLNGEGHTAKEYTIATAIHTPTDVPNDFQNSIPEYMHAHKVPTRNKSTNNEMNVCPAKLVVSLLAFPKPCSFFVCKYNTIMTGNKVKGIDQNKDAHLVEI